MKVTLNDVENWAAMLDTMDRQMCTRLPLPDGWIDFTDEVDELRVSIAAMMVILHKMDTAINDALHEEDAA